MRPPASEKLEIIRLVEQSHLPARRTLKMLGIKPSTFYRWYDRYRSSGPEALEDKPSKPDRVWNRIPDDDVRLRVVMMAFEQPELGPRELATRFIDTNSYYVSESSVYRLLKAHDLITSPAFIVIKADGSKQFPPIQKRIRHRNRLIKRAAGIVAQIDYEALDLVGAELASEVADCFFRGLLVELGDADIADIVTLGMRAHRFHADHVAHDGHVDRLVGAFARNCQFHFGVYRASQLVHSLVERQALHMMIVNCDDDVSAHRRGNPAAVASCLWKPDQIEKFDKNATVRKAINSAIFPLL